MTSSSPSRRGLHREQAGEALGCHRLPPIRQSGYPAGVQRWHASGGRRWRRRWLRGDQVDQWHALPGTHRPFRPAFAGDDPVIARRAAPKQSPADERSSARQAGGCFGAARLAMTGLAGRFRCQPVRVWRPTGTTSCRRATDQPRITAARSCRVPSPMSDLL